MKVYLVQLDIAWHDADANFSRVRSLLETRTISPGSLIVLPELFSAGFTMNLDVATNGEPDRTKSFLREIAVSQQCCVMGGLATRSSENAKGFNEHHAIAPDGSTLARYRKQRLFTHTGEDRHYLPGENTSLFEFGGLRIQSLICYDLRFPELFRTGLSKGADTHVVIANWPNARHDHWTTLLRARAIENQAFVIACNRVGKDPAFTYDGGSQVFDPQGHALCPESKDEGILCTEIEPQSVHEWRAEFPAVRDALDRSTAG